MICVCFSEIHPIYIEEEEVVVVVEEYEMNARMNARMYVLVVVVVVVVVIRVEMGGQPHAPSSHIWSGLILGFMNHVNHHHQPRQFM